MEYEYFRDHRPAAEHHYLVIPKKHFEKITTLTKQDIPMIRRMEKIGMEVNSNSIIYFVVIARFIKNTEPKENFSSCHDFLYFLGFK